MAPPGALDWSDLLLRAGTFTMQAHPHFLAGALAVAALAWWRARRPADFLGFAAPRAVYGHPSARLDYRYFAMTGALFVLVMAPLVMGAAERTEQIAAAFLREGAPGLRLPVSGWAIDLVYTLAVMVAIDLGIFLSHYLQHRVPFLWEFHKVHHSATVLTPITVFRMHPVDTLTGFLLAGILGGATTALFHHLVPQGLSLVTLFHANAFLFLFYLVGYNLRHSHVWVDYGPLWSRVLISPAQHQIHHSKDPRHWDKNLGFLFAWWDALFGTLYVPKERETLELGLSHGEERAFDSVWRLYTRPFVNVARGGARMLRLSPLVAVLLVACAGLIVTVGVLHVVMARPPD